MTMVLAASAVVVAHADTINWGNTFGSTVLQSDGATGWDDGFTIELGKFDDGFTPTPANAGLWAGHWTAFDTVTGAEFNVGAGFYQSSSVLADNDVFGVGDQAYVWVFNNQTAAPGSEWLLFTNSSADGNAGDDWRFPAATGSQQTLPLSWRVTNATVPVFGAFVSSPSGGEPEVGGGVRTPPPGGFDLQTATFAVPEPGVTALLLGGVATFFRRRRRAVAAAAAALALTAPAEADVEGKVFRDFDANGTQQTLEPGVAGVTVTAYDASNAVVATTVTGTNGNYTLSLSAGPVRVEVTNLPQHLKPGVSGTSKPVVFFAANGASGQNVALQNPSDFSDADSELATPCYVNGDPVPAGSGSAQMAWLVRVPWSPAAYAGLNDYLATGEVIGATWGLAWQRSTRTLFSAAVLKRHSGLGTGGIDAIYQTVETPTGPQSSLFLKLGTYGISAGTDPRQAGDLTTVPTTPNRDPNVFDAVGKRGLGDLDISEDEQTLWVVNLANRSLVEIPIGNPAAAPAVGAVVEHVLPAVVTPAVQNGVLRPWAVGIKDGYVYVGATATAESAGGTAAHLRAYILRHDPAGAVGNFTQVHDFALNYPRAYVSNDGAAPTDADWRPWIDAWSDITGPTPGNATWGQTIHPQPLLSDIEFDTDGSMVLGFSDRFGFQIGNYNYSTVSGDTATYEGAVGGDMLRLFKTTTGYALENNATAPAGSANAGTSTGGTSSTPGQGPGGGEWYWQDMYTLGTDKNVGSHMEITLGGLASRYSTGNIATTVFDPAYDYRAGGVGWFSHATGTRTNSYQIFGVDEGGTPATFGKSSGLGDLELLTDPVPLQIGDLVWADANGNGRQDPGESGIPDLTLQLWEDSDGDGTVDTQVGQTVSDGSGGYLFGGSGGSGMLPCGLGPERAVSATIAQSTDDAEQNMNTNAVNVTDATLDVARTSGGTNQMVGLRFCLPGLPQGAQIQSATVQFASQAADSSATNLTIQAQAADNAAAFSAAVSNNIGARTRTTASVAWSAVPEWTVTPLTGKTSAAQRTPDVSALVQEVVSRPGWAPGNCMAFLFSNASGTGLRRAYSYDNTPGRAASLSVRYRTTELCRIVPGRKYEVRLPAAQGAIASLVATAQHADAPQRDSDAALAGGNYAAAVTVEPGRNDHTLDFGLTAAATVSVGNLVFCDLNNNGLFEPAGSDGIPGNADDETGIDGVTVEACDPGPDGTIGGDDDTHGPSATTAGGGFYTITGLTPGQWYLKILNPPVDKPLSSAPYFDQDDQTDNDDNGNQINGVGGTIHSPIITLTAGGEPGPGVDGSDTSTDSTIDFGLVPAASIRGTVWLDNGGPLIGGLPGVELTLCDAVTGLPVDDPHQPGEQPYTTTTSGLGQYTFDGLFPGSYVVKETQPSGLVSVSDGDAEPDVAGSPPDGLDGENDDLIRVSLAAGEEDAGNDFLETVPVSLGDVVFCDENANGGRDPGEPGIGSVTLQLLFDADGSGEIEPGEMTPVAETDTLPNGTYSFTGLRPGGYAVLVAAANFAGGALADKPLVPTDERPDLSPPDFNTGYRPDPLQSPVISRVFDVQPTGLPEPGLTEAGVDFGFYAPATISGTVWLDADYDGVGDDGMPGVTLQLCDENGQPVDDPSDPGEPYEVGTAADGTYAFVNLPPGNYRVKELQPVDYTSHSDGDTTDAGDDAGPDPSGDDVIIVSLEMGETDDGNDFVEWVPTGSICGHVYLDLDNDDDGDENHGLPAVTLVLLVPSGDAVDDLNQPGLQAYFVTTDDDGAYCFTNVPPGDYIVRELQPVGYASVSDVDGGDPDEIGTDVPVSLPPGGLVTGRDFLEEEFVNLGDQVWFDRNNNGIRDAGEPGIEGVELTLCDGAGNAIDSDPLAAGVQPLTTTTDEDGFYLFELIRPGTYQVKIATPPASAPANSTPTISFATAPDDRDRGQQATVGGAVTSLPVTVPPGTTEFGVDFGFYAPMTLGNLVFIDHNLNAFADPGEGVDGVTVVLFADQNGDGDLADAGEGVPVATAVTSGGGLYGFGNLAPGAYVVHVTPANFGPSGPLAGLLSLEGVQVGDDNGGENGIDEPTPAVNGIFSSVVTLRSGAAPVGAAEGGIAGASDNADDANGDLTLDFGFYSLCPTTFSAFQTAWSLGTEDGAADNPDGDIHDNLLEFALCEDPTSGVRTTLGFCVDPNPATNTYRVRFRRPAGVQNTTYTLEIIGDLADSPAGWTDVTDAPSSITPNGDGTETVTYLNIEGQPGVTGTRGFVRLRVDSTAPVATARTEVMGWTDYTAENCATYSNPFLKKEIFSGTVSAGSTTLNVADSVGSSSIYAQLDPSKCYFVEVVGGPWEGHRFEVSVPATTAITIAIDTGSGTNTLTTIPSLAGSPIVLREHFTFAELFPTSGLLRGADAGSADNILAFTNGVGWTTWFVANVSLPGIWVESGDPFLQDAGDRCLPPGVGVFFHRRSLAALTFSPYGVVRDTAFAQPLPTGCTLVGSAYPVAQSPASRVMTTANGFTGSRDLNSSDQVQLWKGDEEPDQLCYVTSWLLHAAAPYRHWIGADDVTAASQNDVELFQPLRAAFHCEVNAVPNWVIPAQWTP